MGEHRAPRSNPLANIKIWKCPSVKLINVSLNELNSIPREVRLNLNSLIQNFFGSYLCAGIDYIYFNINFTNRKSKPFKYDGCYHIRLNFKTYCWSLNCYKLINATCLTIVRVLKNSVDRPISYLKRRIFLTLDLAVRIPTGPFNKFCMVL